MTYFKIGLRHYLFTSAIAFTLFTASTAYSQAPGEIPRDGILSYIFSFQTITILLITGLVAQIVWRKRRRPAHKLEVVHDAPAIQQKRKKRYDRAQMSSLLKASASGAKNPVLLTQTHDAIPAHSLNSSSAQPLEPELAAPDEDSMPVHDESQESQPEPTA